MYAHLWSVSVQSSDSCVCLDMVCRHASSLIPVKHYEDVTRICMHTVCTASVVWYIVAGRMGQAHEYRPREEEEHPASPPPPPPPPTILCVAISIYLQLVSYNTLMFCDTAT